MDEERKVEDFVQFVSDTEPKLRRAFTAAYGSDRGSEAVAEALAYAWEHWDRLGEVRNVPGYLYRVGQSRTRGRKTPPAFGRPIPEERRYEPKLVEALASLSERQRVVVFLVHGEGWTHAEVAEFLGVRPATVQRHVERAMIRLRRKLKVDLP